MKKDRPCGAPPEEIPLMMLINEISRLFHNHMRAENERIGLQEGFRHLLFQLAREDNLSQLEITKRAHLKPPTVSVSLRKMERAGLVTRANDPFDQRLTRVCLTDKGRELDRQERESIRQAEHMFAEGLSDEEQQVLRKLLINMRDAILEKQEQE